VVSGIGRGVRVHQEVTLVPPNTTNSDPKVVMGREGGGSELYGMHA
jgi:hypothetical protein